MNDYAIIAITKQGTAAARKLHVESLGSSLYYPSKFALGDEEVLNIQLYTDNTKELIAKLFSRHHSLVLFIALGAVIRMIAPLLHDKKQDPAIVVVDSSCQHVISVISGHLGGANRLAIDVASLLGARPVITTASDVQGSISVDLLGRELGFQLESFTNVTRVSAAVVNEEPIAVIQEAGETSWYTPDSLPHHITLYADTTAAMDASFNGALVITDRLLSKNEQERFLTNGVLYRPKSLVIGIGCNRNTSAEEIADTILHTLIELGLSFKSVRNLATIDLKQDEVGLLAVSNRFSWPLVCFKPAELNKMSIKNPSEVVFKYTGAYGVSEPAAMLSAGTAELVIEKRKIGNVTLSIARIKFSKSSVVR